MATTVGEAAEVFRAGVAEGVIDGGTAVLRSLAGLPEPSGDRVAYAATIARVTAVAIGHDERGRSSMPIMLDDVADLLHLAALYLREHPEA